MYIYIYTYIYVYIYMCVCVCVCVCNVFVLSFYTKFYRSESDYFARV